MADGMGEASCGNRAHALVAAAHAATEGGRMNLHGWHGALKWLFFVLIVGWWTSVGIMLAFDLWGR